MKRYLCLCISLLLILSLCHCETTHPNESVIIDEMNSATSSTAEIKQHDASTANDQTITETTPSIVDETTDVTEQLSELTIHYIDVGEADSALIICDGEAMLVDAGNIDDGSSIRLYMKQQGVYKLKYLLLTHSDRDHIGGAASVISNMDVETLFMCAYEKDNDTYHNLLNEINYKSMTWSTPEVGSTYALGSAEITIIAPNREYANPNDSSIAFVVRHGYNSFLFSGDAEGPAERDIVNNGLDISADVYYVGHHGSNTSSGKEFLDKMNPSYAVISCAKDNDYGHPHKETMETLQERGVNLFRTDDQGTIIAYSDGNNLSFNVGSSNNWSSGEGKSASTIVSESLESESKVIESQETTGDKSGNLVTEEPATISYVCNTNTMKFHYPSCGSVDDMKAKNRSDVTLTREEVIALGYEPCKRCKP